ncbi:MAG: regulatory protein RecX [Bacteroides sp.]|nr:regulatory protein RecX [Bacteroides sp.]
MKKEITEQTAKTRLAAFCATRERCKQEVEKKLQGWELSQETAKRIVQWLEKENFLDEQRYCKAYVNDKYKIAKWGKRKIEYNLRNKGINPAMISEHLAKVDTDSYNEKLSYLLEQKKKTVKAKNEYDLRQKLIRFAAGRGYDFADIANCLRKMNIECDDE